MLPMCYFQCATLIQKPSYKVTVEAANVLGSRKKKKYKHEIQDKYDNLNLNSN